jgi:hypothetical protein
LSKEIKTREIEREKNYKDRERRIEREKVNRER